MVSMVIFPVETGSLETKSNAVCDPGRYGVTKGSSKLVGHWLWVLFQAQGVQAVTYSLTSLSRVSHQKYLMNKEVVLLLLEWPVFGQYEPSPGRAAAGT